MIRILMPLTCGLCLLGGVLAVRLSHPTPWAILATAEAAQKYQATTLEEAPPEEVSEAIRKALAKGATRVVDSKGKPLLDLWLVQAAATRAEPATDEVEFGFLEEGALVAVARMHAKGKDFKGNKYKPGAYTCRYAVLPEDGDHQGVSETRDFLLLSPAAADTSTESKTPEELVELSKKTSKGGHPAVLYLAKPLEEGAKLPRVAEDQDLAHWFLDCELPSASKGKPPARMRIVILGQSPDF